MSNPIEGLLEGIGSLLGGAILPIQRLLSRFSSIQARRQRRRPRTSVTRSHKPTGGNQPCVGGG